MARPEYFSQRCAGEHFRPGPCRIAVQGSCCANMRHSDRTQQQQGPVNVHVPPERWRPTCARARAVVMESKYNERARRTQHVSSMSRLTLIRTEILVVLALPARIQTCQQPQAPVQCSLNLRAEAAHTISNSLHCDPCNSCLGQTSRKPTDESCTKDRCSNCVPVCAILPCSCLPRCVVSKRQH